MSEQTAQMKAFSELLPVVNETIEQFRYRGVIAPKYKVVINDLIVFMEAAVVLDETGLGLNTHASSKRFTELGLKESFLRFYWEALQFFTNWKYSRERGVLVTEEETESQMRLAFVYLNHIVSVLGEIPSIRPA